MNFQRLKDGNNSVKTASTRFLIRLIALTTLLLLLSSCAHYTYTPAQSQERIHELENQVDTLHRLLKEAESDLSKCTTLLKKCQPLINPQP